MNKTIIIVTLAIILFVFAVTALRPAQNDIYTEFESTEVESITFTNEDTLSSLQSSNLNLVCTFSHSTEATGEIEGAVYVTPQNMRVNFAYSNDGRKYTSTIIYTSEDAYYWGNTPQGSVAVTFPKEQNTLTDSVPVSQNETVPLSCSGWMPDQKQFEVPTNVSFSNFGATQNEVYESPDIKNSIECQKCDTLTGEDKIEQCRTAFTCY